MDSKNSIRLVFVALRLGDGRYQVQVRQGVGGNGILYTRRVQGATSAAKREVERLFGKLNWQLPPERLKQSEPNANQVAYLNVQPVVDRVTI